MKKTTKLLAGALVAGSIALVPLSVSAFFGGGPGWGGWGYPYGYGWGGGPWGWGGYPGYGWGGYPGYGWGGYPGYGGWGGYPYGGYGYPYAVQPVTVAPVAPATTTSK